MATVQLTHHCNKPGCEGRIGDVIEVSAKDAAYLLDRGGAKRVPGNAAAAAESKSAPETTEKPTPETADKPPPKSKKKS